MSSNQEEETETQKRYQQPGSAQLDESRNGLTREVSANGGQLQADLTEGMLDAEHAQTFNQTEGSKQETEQNLDLAQQAFLDVKSTLGKYNPTNKEEIVQTYEEVNDMIHQLDTLHSAIIQKHQADFIASYKDHMVKVQMEMAEFRKKTSDYYLNMKKSEKIRLLEHSLTIFREGCIKMTNVIDELKGSNKKLSQRCKFAESEVEAWHDEAKTLKFQNVILRNAVNQLKSPTLINKYEERGREQVEQQLKRLLTRGDSRSKSAVSKSANSRQQKRPAHLIMSGEGQIKNSTIGDGTTIDRDYKLFEAEELEKADGDKIKANLDNTQPVHSISLQPKAITSHHVGTMNVTSPLNQSSLREFDGIDKLHCQKGRATQHSGIQTTSQVESTITDAGGAPLTKPSSANPNGRMAHNAKGKFGSRLMSSRDRKSKGYMMRNQTMVHSIKQVAEDEETKAVTNSHLWGNLGDSASNSQMFSYSRLHHGLQQIQSHEQLVSEEQVTNLINIFHTMQDQPEEMKKYVAHELALQSDKVARLAERVRQLERKKLHNQDLSLTVSHTGSLEAGINSQSGPLSSGQISRPEIRSKATLAETQSHIGINSQQLPTLQQVRMPPELVQDCFFQCIESLVKVSKSSSRSKSNLRSSSGHFSPEGSMTRLPNNSRNINDGLQAQKQFQKLTDKSKQDVLLNFIKNKQVLRSLYDLMFSQKDARSANTQLTKTHSSAIDFNRLMMHHQKDAQLLSRLPNLNNNERYRRTGSTEVLSAQHMMKSLRRRDSNSIEQAAQDAMERERRGNTETLNVVVSARAYQEQENSQSHTQGFVTMSRNMMKTNTVTEHQNQQHYVDQNDFKSNQTGNFSDRVHTQVLPSQNDALSFAQKPQSSGGGGADVLASGEKMRMEINSFAHRYGQDASPLDNPKSQAYLNDTNIASQLQQVIGNSSRSREYMINSFPSQQTLGQKGPIRSVYGVTKQRQENRSREGYRQKPPRLLVDQGFANSNEKKANKTLNNSMNNVVPRSLRPKPQMRAQSSYRIKSGKLLLGVQQAHIVKRSQQQF